MEKTKKEASKKLKRKKYLLIGKAEPRKKGWQVKWQIKMCWGHCWNS